MHTLTRFALIGKGISHSKSPEIYKRLIGSNIFYDLLEINKGGDLPSSIELSKRYDGVNITTPWKKNYAQFAVSEVTHLQAVNCLRFEENICQATNTDWTAIREILPKILEESGAGKSCVLLGNGVMANVFLDVCSQLSLSVTQYSRSNGDQLESLDLMNNQACPGPMLIINACGRDFKFQGNLSGAWVFWDFNYSHSFHETEIPSDLVRYIDGLELLETQAKHAIQFWNRTLSH